MNSIAWPLALFAGAMAHALDPVSPGASRSAVIGGAPARPSGGVAAGEGGQGLPTGRQSLTALLAAEPRESVRGVARGGSESLPTVRQSLTAPLAAEPRESV